MNQTLIAVDQLLNALLFRGWADETISARAYRNAAQGKQKWVRFERWINRLFFWQANHCEKSHRMEVDRLHMPPAYRTIYNSVMTTQFSDEVDANETSL